MSDTPTERLNKYLALQLGISRREADNLIEKGRVSINGATAILGARFTLGDHISVGNKQITDSAHLQYIMFNKPVGYVCSRRAQGDNPTIYSILPPEFKTLKPVGRLDKDSSGLLVLSNDGDFGFRMTHPKFAKTKVYHVKLDHDLEPLHQQMISDYGITLEDGSSKLALTRLSDTNRSQWEVTMAEGRNRQIRRTFAALGYTVVDLHRTQFGSYTLNALKVGDYMPITEQS